MCVGICAIAMQRGDLRLLFKSGINSHSEIRKAFGIGDDRQGEQVNLEAHPTGKFIDHKSWKIVVDHDQANIPRWFIDNQVEIEGLFRDFFEAEIKEIKATKKYNGSLNLCETSIEELPSGLNVGGSLYLRGTSIKKEDVPEHLKDKCIF